ncbi:MAG: CapA family protein [Thermomicrobiales bacterium]
MAIAPPDTFRLALTGDSIIMRPIAHYRDEPTLRLMELLREADVAFTNLEMLPNGFRGYPAVESGGSHLAGPERLLDDLLAMGFDLFAFANNHSLDYSIEGLLASMETLEEHGAAYAGVGRTLAEARMPVYLDSPVASVALIAGSATFQTGQEAGDQRPDMHGRPGLNPLRFDTIYHVRPDQLATLREIAGHLGLEAQRLDKIQLGFGFPPDDPESFPFLDHDFQEAERPSVTTTPKAKDLEAFEAWTREANLRADIVVVSIHAHEQGEHKEDPAAFLRAFAHDMIDHGADVVVGHGPHLLRGMEFYRGKPIFYSLGNFIGQNELVHKLPADSYDRFRVEPSKTPGELFRIRNAGDTKSFAADSRFWESIVPICVFADGRLKEVELHPVVLGHGEAPYRRGRPRLAQGEAANNILDRFATLSKPFGAIITRDGERGIATG